MSKRNRQTHKPQTRSRKKIHKERGIWVGLFLVLMILQGIIATYLFYQYQLSASVIDRPVTLALMILHSLANIAAAVGIWLWKRWGLFVYAGSTLLALIVGILAVGMWSTFSIILPFVILMWLLQEKLSYFD
jgi:hypothetical protein